MKLRTHKVSTTAFFGATVAVLITGFFFFRNTGVNPVNPLHGEFDPQKAPGLSLGLLLAVHLIAIALFSEDKTNSDGSSADRARSDDPFSRFTATFTAFIRQPGYKVFSVGPIWAFFAAASIFVWHAFAEYPGQLGTVWGDYAHSPLPAFAIFFACWAMTNLGFTFAALAEAFNRDIPGLFLTFILIMFALAGTTCVFFSFDDAPTGGALVSTCVTLLITTAALVPARMFAQARVARIDRESPTMSPREQRRSEKFGSSRPRTEARPPFDLLQPSENLLVHFNGAEGNESRMLLATSTRLVLAAVDQTGRTVVLDEASPGQLLGGGSGNRGQEAVTGIRLRDRQDLMVNGGDPSASTRFAEALDSLARTGRLPD